MSCITLATPESDQSSWFSVSSYITNSCSSFTECISDGLSAATSALVSESNPISFEPICSVDFSALSSKAACAVADAGYATATSVGNIVAAGTKITCESFPSLDDLYGAAAGAKNVLSLVKDPSAAKNILGQVAVYIQDTITTEKVFQAFLHLATNEFIDCNTLTNACSIIFSQPRIGAAILNGNAKALAAAIGDAMKDADFMSLLITFFAERIATVIADKLAVELLVYVISQSEVRQVIQIFKSVYEVVQLLAGDEFGHLIVEAIFEKSDPDQRVSLLKRIDLTSGNLVKNYFAKKVFCKGILRGTWEERVFMLFELFPGLFMDIPSGRRPSPCERDVAEDSVSRESDMATGTSDDFNETKLRHKPLLESICRVTFENGQPDGDFYDNVEKVFELWTIQKSGCPDLPITE